MKKILKKQILNSSWKDTCSFFIIALRSFYSNFKTIGLQTYATLYIQEQHKYKDIEYSDVRCLGQNIALNTITTVVAPYQLTFLFLNGCLTLISMPIADKYIWISQGGHVGIPCVTSPTVMISSYKL